MIKITPKNEKIYPEISFQWKNPLDSSDNIVIIGENLKIRPPCTIYWGTQIGNDCTINHYSIIREKSIIGNNSKIGNGTTLDGNLKIGNNVSIHTNCFIANYTIIEDNVFIGPSCTITNVRKIKHGRNFPLIEDTAIIGYASRIGGGCTILPGIKVGREALIGAGSVVTKNIPDNSIAIGVPAKVKGLIPDDEKYPLIN
ncbi:acyltransferase [Candidatus Harpocratesius sp.]